MSELSLPAKHSQAVNGFIAHIEQTLKSNLYSVVIYGSAVRGGFDARTSDVNLLIVLEVSTPEAHQVIGEAINKADVLIEPFVLTRTGIERSFRAFAPKFDSIRRHYQVMQGADPLTTYERDGELARFLLEQALRNLRLRSVQAYIHLRTKPKEYGGYLTRTIPVLMTDLAEVLRFDNQEVPNGFEERVPLLAERFQVSESGLAKLLDLGVHPRPLSQQEVDDTHRFLFGLLDRAVTQVSES